MKILFPNPTDWKRARLIRRDDKYVIQSRYNDKTQKFEQEIEISVDEECAELKAFNLYSEIYNSAVVNKLQQRTDFIKFCLEHQPKEEIHERAEIR